MYKFRIRLNIINIIFININYIFIYSRPPSLSRPAVDSVLVLCLPYLGVQPRSQFVVDVDREAASCRRVGILYLVSVSLAIPVRIKLVPAP